MTEPYNYVKRNFTDHIVNSETGEVIQQGLPLNATTFGPMDELLFALSQDVPQISNELQLLMDYLSFMPLDGGGFLDSSSIVWDAGTF